MLKVESFPKPTRTAYDLQEGQVAAIVSGGTDFGYPDGTAVVMLPCSQGNGSLIFMGGNGDVWNDVKGSQSRYVARIKVRVLPSGLVISMKAS